MLLETSFIETTGRGRRAWATLFSAAAQSAVAAGLILISMIRTELIAVPRFATVIGAPPARPVATRSRVSATPVAASDRIFRLPALTYASSKAEPVEAAFEGAPDIVSGGIWVGGDRAAFQVGDIIGTLPPRPRPVEPKETAPPPKPAAAAPPRINVSTGVQSAKLIHQVQPVYPPLAKQARIQGTVRLLAVITTDGRIQSLRAESGHPLLVPAALDAVGQWLYRPTLLNDQPVEVVTQIQVVFTLK